MRYCIHSVSRTFCTNFYEDSRRSFLQRAGCTDRRERKGKRIGSCLRAHGELIKSRGELRVFHKARKLLASGKRSLSFVCLMYVRPGLNKELINFAASCRSVSRPAHTIHQCMQQQEKSSLDFFIIFQFIIKLFILLSTASS